LWLGRARANSRAPRPRAFFALSPEPLAAQQYRPEAPRQESSEISLQLSACRRRKLLAQDIVILISSLSYIFVSILKYSLLQGVFNSRRPRIPEKGTKKIRRRREPAEDETGF
jgi:hypothetical protein